jgi:hypothetical protein
MVHCAAALANHAEGRLMTFANELLQNGIARERSLGVSILAWIGNQESIDLLAGVFTTDHSNWVRGHAKWANEVSLQELSARNFFRRLCHETDPYMMSGGLQTLKPALTPLAHWWSEAILEHEKAEGLVLPPKCEALLTSFWHHQNSAQSSHVAVAGRKLDDFCRGVKLDQLTTAKLAPWWKLD